MRKPLKPMKAWAVTQDGFLLSTATPSAIEMRLYHRRRDAAASVVRVVRIGAPLRIVRVEIREVERGAK